MKFYVLDEDDLLFDSIMADKGGVHIDRDEYYKLDKIRINNLINVNKKDLKLIKPFPSINFNIINNLNLGATTKLHKDDYFAIGINDGSKLLLFDLFHRMLSYIKVLKDIGKPEIEKYETPTLRNFYSDVALLEKYGDFDYKDYKLLIPKDPIRKQYASLLTDISFDYLFEHELSHILFGHLHFVKYLFNSDYDKVPKITQQTLEMDADCTSINRSVNLAILLFDNQHLINPASKIFFSTIEDSIVNTFLAIYVTFRIKGDIFSKKMNEQSHPPPRVRQLILKALIEEYLKRIHDSRQIDYEILNMKINNRFIEVEQAFKLITGLETNKEPFEAENYNKNPIANNMLNHWKDLRKELEPYTFKPLAP